MINQFHIEPKKVEATATFILIESRISLNQNAEFTYSLCDESGKPLKYGQLVLSPEQYAAWGDDDTYVLDLICAQEGITIVA
jgi:hypothetical protein